DLDRSEQRALDTADARALEERVAGRIGREEIEAPRAEAFAEQVVDDQQQRDQRGHRRREDQGSGDAIPAPAAGAHGEACQRVGRSGVRAHAPAAFPATRAPPGGVSRPVPELPARAALTTSARAIPLTSSVRTNSTR